MPNPPLQPLSVRALDVAITEAARWRGDVVADDQVASYLGGVERVNVPGLGPWLATQRRNGKRIAWCAAAIGWAEAQARRPDESVPPWRAGARELKTDAQEGSRGVWVPAAMAGRGQYIPRPGALAIYWRGSPDAWTGHAEMILGATDVGYQSLGGNERGGRWWADQEPVSYQHPKLLGFVARDDPAAPELVPEPQPVEPPPDLYDEDDDEVEVPRLVHLTPDWDAIRKDVQRIIAESDEAWGGLWGGLS